MTHLLSIIAVGLLLAAVPDPSRAQTPEEIAKGAQVWAQNCTRCHNGRASLERNDRDWTTIVLHMRARANLTRSEANAVATFMKATNAPEPGVAPPSQPAITSSASESKTEPATGERADLGIGFTAPSKLSEMDVRSIAAFLRTMH